MKRRLISFDLDDTLRLHAAGAPCEPHAWKWLFRWLWPEPLRPGTVALITELQWQGWEIAIYTTSARGETYIRRWLRCYGIKISLVVNAASHARVVGPRFTSGRMPSKHPGLFGIELHIDDSEGVAIEGRRYSFHTLILSPDDPHWATRVLEHVADWGRT